MRWYLAPLMYDLCYSPWRKIILDAFRLSQLSCAASAVHSDLRAYCVEPAFHRDRGLVAF